MRNCRKPHLLCAYIHANKLFMNNMLDISGKTALITGASSPIGAEIARTLAKAGARVLLHYGSNKTTVQKLAGDIEGAIIIRSNLTRPKQIKKMIADLGDEGLLPDFLVNNAGVQTVAGLAEADEKIWQEINKVNLEAVYSLTRELSNALVSAGKKGAFVNIASIEGLDPANGHSHYAASKAALIMFTKASALELGAKGIRVNAIAPGLIAREGIEKEWPDGVKRWQKRAPLGRLGDAQDIANSVLFLLSPASVWITGHTLIVDGGMSAQTRW